MNRVIDLLVPYGVFLRHIEGSTFPHQWARVVFQLLPFTFFVLWVFSFIPLLGSLVYMLVLVPLSVRRHIELNGIEGREKRAHLYLWYYTVILIGFAGMWSFFGHFFLSDMVAERIGWATGSPFQIELAFYTLGSAVAGIMAIWLRGHMITALVVSKAIFWYGAAYVHIMDAIFHANFAPYNVGAVLIGDIVYPTVLLFLLIKAWPVLNTQTATTNQQPSKS